MAKDFFEFVKRKVFQCAQFKGCCKNKNKNNLFAENMTKQFRQFVQVQKIKIKTTI